MKTGAELINFKSFVSQNKQSIEDFEKLKMRQITDRVKDNKEILEIDNESDETKSDADILIINGGTNIKKYQSFISGN